MSKIVPPLKGFGYKQYLAKTIISLFCEHKHYIECYGGGMSVLLNKNPEGFSEVYNDIDYNLTNFWQVLQDPDTFNQFYRRIEATPFSEIEWEEAHRLLEEIPLSTEKCVEGAVLFFINCRQSMLGMSKTFAPLSKNRTRRQQNEQVSSWLTVISGLPEVHSRLKRIVITCKNALDVIDSEDSANSLFYADPPYYHETRTVKNAYSYELDDAGHELLLKKLITIRGKAVVSAYDCSLYNDILGVAKWRKHVVDVPNSCSTASQKDRREEVLFMNY